MFLMFCYCISKISPSCINLLKIKVNVMLSIPIRVYRVCQKGGTGVLVP
jgi:hypothetical protein